MHDMTLVLNAIDQSDPHAAEQLLPLVYEELRKLATQKLAQEKPGQTLQATALVHEAYLRLVDVDQVQRWDSRGHFFAAAAATYRPNLEVLEDRCLLSGDVVLHWNQLALDAIRQVKPNPLVASRILAIEQVAVYDAVNAIDRSFTPYFAQVHASHGASREAAAA
jgi:hypothetical protein